MKRVLLSIFSLLFFSGCQTATEKLDSRKKQTSYSRVYFSSYEETDMALKQAMIRYPQRIDNTAEAGIFETDYVKGDLRFRAPGETTPHSPGYRYRILVRLVKGKAEEKNSTKVQLIKKPEVSRDFFSEPQPIPSDGLEEEVLLYRIGRELQINRALTKANDKRNKQNK